MWTFLASLLIYLGYGFIIAVYVAFAWFNKTMPNDLIVILTGALGVLGTVHISSAATKAAVPPKSDMKDIQP